MLRVVKYFLDNKIAVNVFVIGLFISGLISFSRIPKEGMPGIELNQVQILPMSLAFSWGAIVRNNNHAIHYPCGFPFDYFKGKQ